MTTSDDLVIFDQQTIIGTVERETAALVDDLLGGFLDIDLQGQPVLEQFTGGHILTHLSREADRMADELRASTGRVLPPIDTDRRWEVEQGGLRPGAVLIDDLVEASSRLRSAMQEVDDWSTLSDASNHIPAHRLVQLVVHHADLQRPWGSVPEQNAKVALSQLPSIMPTELSNVRLVAQSNQSPTVHSSLGQTVIQGDPRTLLAWASGRSDAHTDTDLPTISRRVWF